MEPLTFEQLIGRSFMEALHAAEVTIQGLAVLLVAFLLVVGICFAVETIKENGRN